MNVDRNSDRPRWWQRRVVHVSAILVVLSVLTLISVIVIFPTPKLPAPGGQYRIGTRVVHWTDDSRKDPFTAEPDDKRELVAQIWYPARPNSDAETDRYVDSPAVLDGYAAAFNVPGFFLASVKSTMMHAYLDAPPAIGKFPVLLFVGDYNSSRRSATFWIEELVSRGYIVLSLDHPGLSAATVLTDGRIIEKMDQKEFNELLPYALSKRQQDTSTLRGQSLPGGVVPFLTQDVTFALEQLIKSERADSVLLGHIDFDRLGIIGFGVGGYVAGQVAKKDARIKACLIAESGQLPEIQQNSIPQPVLVLARTMDSMRRENSRTRQWNDELIKFTVAGERGLFVNSKSTSYYVTLDRISHLDWTDLPRFSPAVAWLGQSGPEPIDSAQDLITSYSVAFFERALRGQQESPILSGPPPSAPWVKVERNID